MRGISSDASSAVTQPDLVSPTRCAIYGPGLLSTRHRQLPCVQVLAAHGDAVALCTPLPRGRGNDKGAETLCPDGGRQRGQARCHDACNQEGSQSCGFASGGERRRRRQPLQWSQRRSRICPSLLRCTSSCAPSSFDIRTRGCGLMLGVQGAWARVGTPKVLRSISTARTMEQQALRQHPSPAFAAGRRAGRRPALDRHCCAARVTTRRSKHIDCPRSSRERCHTRAARPAVSLALASATGACHEPYSISLAPRAGQQRCWGSWSGRQAA